jgi:hypothetical protein
MKIRYLALGLLALPLMGNDGCEPANRAEAKAVGRQQEIYVTNQPAPTFDFSLERHLLIQLYTARNQAVGTYSYVQSEFNGKVLWGCPSIGFPIPANTQLTNPDLIDYNSHGAVTLPQAEPNGLYSSPSTSGTFIMCTGKNGEIIPVYEERTVSTFVTPMKEVNGTLLADGVPSLTLKKQ